MEPGCDLEPGFERVGGLGRDELVREHLEALLGLRDQRFLLRELLFVSTDLHGNLVGGETSHIHPRKSPTAFCSIGYRYISFPRVDNISPVP